MKKPILPLLSLLAVALAMQMPLSAKSHSSDDSKKCCKKNQKYLKKINATTEADLVIDRTNLAISQQIIETALTDLAVDRQTLEIVTDTQNLLESQTYDIAGDYSEAVPHDTENVFNPVLRDESPFSEFNENILTPTTINTILTQVTDLASNYKFQYYLHGNLNIPQPFPVAIERMADLAEQAVGKYIFAYVGPQGVADNGDTYWKNLRAIKSYDLLPKMATGASAKPFVFTHTVHFGAYTFQVPKPIFVCPMGDQTILHQGGDKETAQGAADANVSFCYSSASTFTPEEIKASDPQGDLFFQMYATSVPQLNLSIIQRAFAAGYRAIILTLDTTKYSQRERELEFGYFPFAWKASAEPGERFHGLEIYLTDPVFNTIQTQQFGTVANAAFINLPGGPYAVNLNDAFLLGGALVNSSASVTWDEQVPGDPFAINWFVNQVTTIRNLPLILKGILREDDARRAVQKGCSGVYVSNHGGRQVQGAIAAIDALQPVALAVADEAQNLNVPKPAILFDSGIRRGADVVKAYALGAEWVGVGRPCLYGLAAGGHDGVEHVLKTILSDLELTTQNMGYTDVSLVTSADIQSNP
ncbi:MAG: alpha-hydroxy-acid oxidizing protein [Chlamydiales bacterium]|nr:alpha-hydroxy-acid oxidizing protein [Chlamydiales bacterium]